MAEVSIIKNIYFKPKSEKWDKEGHYIIIKGLIQPEGCIQLNYMLYTIIYNHTHRWYYITPIIYYVLLYIICVSNVMHGTT